ncbi:MAG: GNAT family N-acetyltransferase [Spirochaetales bacterium]|nr:GNAT family N-acetyltransferase [Spirochaetales bacterium]
MSWRIAQKNEYKDVAAFIIKHECTNLTFSSKLKESNGSYRDFIILINRANPDDSIMEAIMITGHGQLIPVLAAKSRSQKERYERELSGFLTDNAKNIYSIIGTEDSVKTLEAIFTSKPYQVLEYYLMVLPVECFKPAVPFIPAGIHVRKAGTGDADKIFPIQKLYELEEVCLHPKQFNERTCMIHLKMSLSSQLVLYLEKAGTVIAKAQTNARGFHADQIGGVFTLTEKRKSGLASLVMEMLLKEIFSRKEAACLFVKKSNTAAINLYKKLNFNITGGYRIAYYL